MEFTFTFIRLFFWSIYLVGPIIIFFLFTIFILGQVVRHIESWTVFDGAYWSFITALTVGYGDIRPLRKMSKALSVVIALIGMMFTGVVIAVTLSSTSLAFEIHGNQQLVEKMKHQFKQPEQKL